MKPEVGTLLVGARAEAWFVDNRRENGNWVKHKFGNYLGVVVRCEFVDHETEQEFVFLIMDEQGYLHVHTHRTVRVR